MKELLNELTVFIVGIVKLIPIAANATIGAIGDLLDTLGHAKAIILAIAALLIAAIKWTRSRLKR